VTRIFDGARESLHQYSTAGAYGAYRYLAKSADARVRDAEAWSPERGHVTVAALSSEGDGTADAIMLQRVEAKLSGEDARPGTDLVTVRSAEIIPYEVRVVIEMYPGVAGNPPHEEARKRLELKVAELNGLGLDVSRTALIAAAHVEGVKTVDLVQPEVDIPIARHQVAWCAGIEIGSRIAHEP
jgi:phage-related baseplate assembly protein